MRKELVKIGVSLALGLLLAFLIPIRRLGGWNYLVFPVYLLGFFYGAATVIPWIGKMIASSSKMMMMSIIMKSLLGVILLLVFLPVVLAVLLSVGWIIGMVKLVVSLKEALELELELGQQRRELHGGWGLCLKNERRQRRSQTPPDDYDYDSDDDDY